MTRRPDEEQRFREERAAERDHGREPASARPGRRELAGRDALRLKLADRGAAQDDAAAGPEPPAIDLDMRPGDVGAANRWRAYTSGWRVGARCGVPDPKATGHADRGIAEAYQAGYDAGRRAFTEAAQIASERYGYTPSPLRTEQTP